MLDTSLDWLTKETEYLSFGRMGDGEMGYELTQKFFDNVEKERKLR